MTGSTTRRTPESRNPDFSWVAPFLGLLACVGGVFNALLGLLQADVSFETVGIVLGVAGYLLGRRVFGALTIALSVFLIIVTLAMYQGYLPQFGPVDLRIN